MDLAEQRGVTREQVEHFEALMLIHPDAAPVDIPVEHRFATGLYAREITIPAGTLMTGKVHKADHVSIILSGEMNVLTETGMRHVVGPEVYISPAGTKRIGIALTDVRWITVHVNPDDSRDIELIEARVAEPWTPEMALARAGLGEIECQS